jgi:hypothetical protein
MRLSDPPPDVSAFVQFGADLIHSDRIMALLQAG